MIDLDHLPNLATIPAPKPPREFKMPTAEEVMVARVAVDQLRNGIAPDATTDTRDVAAELAAIQLPAQPDEVPMNQATQKAYDELRQAQAERRAGAEARAAACVGAMTLRDLLGYAAIAAATVVAGLVVIGLVAGVDSWGWA